MPVHQEVVLEQVLMEKVHQAVVALQLERQEEVLSCQKKSRCISKFPETYIFKFML